MDIRCPRCKRLFDYDPASGPARCTHEGCGWEFQQQDRAAAVDSQEHSETDVAPVELELLEETSSNNAVVAQPSNSPTIHNAGHSLVGHDRDNPAVGTMRCPACKVRVPEDAIICPACGTDMDMEFGRQEGVRAMFDVSGDITFTPKMVALLFVITLAAFLAFTWIISGKNSQEEFVPIALSGTTADGSTEAGHVSSLQGTEFAQLQKEFLDARTTDLRRDVLREKFRGERVIWNGIVTSVERDGQAFRVEVVMGDPDSHGYVSLHALKHDANDRIIADLRRGEQVMFSGSIEQFHTGGAYDPMDFFRVELVNGLLLN